MHLIDQLSALLAQEQSYFRQHLLKEDIARLEALATSVTTDQGRDHFIAAGRKLGWTPDDRRTHELTTLPPLLDAIFALRTARDDAERARLDAVIGACWIAFDTERIDKLAGCLARVPKVANGDGA